MCCHASTVPRRPIAEEVLKALKDVEGDGKYIVVYDFKLGKGGRIPLRFYRNLRVLMNVLGGVRAVQKSVLMCEGARAALAIVKLVEHYGGNVRMFRVIDDNLLEDY